MTQARSLRNKPPPGDCGGDLEVSQPPPSAATPVHAFFGKTAKKNRSPVGNGLRKPVIKPQVRRVNLLGKILVGSFVDHQEPAWRDDSPHFGQIGIPGFRYMFQYAVCQDKGERFVLERKRRRFGNMDQSGRSAETSVSQHPLADRYPVFIGFDADDGGRAMVKQRADGQPVPCSEVQGIPPGKQMTPLPQRILDGLVTMDLGRPQARRHFVFK